ncbi:alpha-ribazole phosphatase [Chitinophaga costaii]|uniref:Alpha-ribazole phosphatase n=1 Tax=Chitinophaga costaii TaxID=1335309 RepID=A0A1C4F6W7_9BACT|nr:alpha-ribazole phosphatase [Chitinophaga costaii]SCC51779.1 alpha-ribazole phosphatase [Chitinophaga costaii]
MRIYLIRHTTPSIPRGTCYGFTDLDLAPTFETEASRLLPLLPTAPLSVYASPLQRCHRLAQFLFPSATIALDHRLKELNFGDWEMQRWDNLGENALQEWMTDYVHTRVPNGESYKDLYTRSIESLLEIVAAGQDSAIVTHGGVIRSILAYVMNTPLEKSFDTRVEWGRMARLDYDGHTFRVAGIDE